MVFFIVGMVMWTAPLGAFGAIAFTVGKFGVGSLLRSASCWRILSDLHHLHRVAFGRSARCGFSLWKLDPLHQGRAPDLHRDHVVGNGAAAHDRQARALGCEKSVVGLVVPTGYSFNLDGTCLYLATAAVFLAQATNTPLDIWHQIGLLLICWSRRRARPASPARPSWCSPPTLGPKAASRSQASRWCSAFTA
jgi:aerobic C4-dicarboxylate transport protein